MVRPLGRQRKAVGECADEAPPEERMSAPLVIPGIHGLSAGEETE